MEKTNLEIFREYVSICGYEIVGDAWIDRGYCAIVHPNTPIPCKDFTEVVMNGQMVRLGYADLNNELIIKGRVKFNKD